MKRTRVRAAAVGSLDSPPQVVADLPIGRGDTGMVIVETAIAIPMLVAVAAAMCWGVTVAGANLRVGDAARTAARDLARGEAVSAVLARAEAAVPGAEVRIDDAGELVAVVVSEDVVAPVPILRGISVLVTQRVAVPREWT